ncbi:MAG: hypothetical protein Ct9H300mP26_2850 [Acidimicrobiales bacterium]|nr:MAG: hypothetical protein Ct9H300mP26_2850 [Acidimicrobiales bacterium]
MVGWLDDVARSVRRLRDEGSQQIWLVGSTTGGSLAIMAAAQDPEIRGVAAMAPEQTSTIGQLTHVASYSIVEMSESSTMMTTPIR